MRKCFCSVERGNVTWLYPDAHGASRWRIQTFGSQYVPESASRSIV
ncbi:MAG TPA: hypothetical protein VHQ69_04815 [Methylomirabilota bacterium]|jgi:hypothetical protein|nr:hypothetical protein [Methylomirabilota bacterium]